jgi:hypothetical protein
MASLVLLVAAAVASEPQASPVQRPFHEIQQQLSELLKREAQAKTETARASAISDLCNLHQQVVRDIRYPTSDVLKEYRAKLWSRLVKTKSELKQRLARDSKNAAALQDAAALESTDAIAVVASDSLAHSLALLDQSQGGPSALLNFGGRAIPPDYGPALVDLIERTINPAFWDVVGGPGTIAYYAPLQCLVVRATSEVHENLGGLVLSLRGGP